MQNYNQATAYYYFSGQFYFSFGYFFYADKVLEKGFA